VDGGVGRYDFGTHRVQRQEGGVFNTAVDLFDRLKAKGVYRTRWFREIGLFHGCTDLSYRKTVEGLNRVRQQPGATGLRTLCNAAAQEAEDVEMYLERRVDELLSNPRFDPDGRPRFRLDPETPETGLQPENTVASAIQQCLPEDAREDISIEELAANSVAYEASNCEPAISIDDVGVKKQKANRKAGVADRKTGKKRAWTTVVHVERGGARYTLTGSSVAAALRLTSALLVASGLEGVPLLFFTDGQRSLKDAIFDFWRTRGRIRLILDWYHLQKKCRELGSLGLKGSIAAKKIHIQQLRRLLWYGLVDRAIQYISGIPPEAVRKPDVLNQIKGYLERNRPHIPCYAARSKLGLRCSSNKVEKENDVVVANRQKRNGMSWSEQGSHAVATLTAVRRNGEEQQWLRERCLSFCLPDAA